MDAAESKLVKDLVDDLKMWEESEDWYARPMLVTASNSNYGKPATIIIELQGSPPHFRIVFDLHYNKVLLFLDKHLQWYSKKQTRVTQFVREILKYRGIGS